VKTLVEGAQGPGLHETAWDGRSQSGGQMPSGIYFIRSSVAGETSVARLVYMH
jgi:flagellar hook assembly protein FlgD